MFNNGFSCCLFDKSKEVLYLIVFFCFSLASVEAFSAEKNVSAPLPEKSLEIEGKDLLELHSDTVEGGGFISSDYVFHLGTSLLRKTNSDSSYSFREKNNSKDAYFFGKNLTLLNVGIVYSF